VLVNHFNSRLSGGAATAALRLHSELRCIGINSRFYHGEKTIDSDECDPTHELATWPAEPLGQRIMSAINYRVYRESFKRAVGSKRDGNEIFTSPRAPQKTPWKPNTSKNAVVQQTEILHLHWIAKLLDYESFFESLGPDQPVVWTLHDMNAFTGGCHFTGGCENYNRGCGNCPQIARSAQRDISQQSFAIKQQALKDINLHVVAPSRWLLDRASSSLMLEHAKSFTHIPYGISTADYYPMDRLEARARLGIDPNVIVVGFGAMDVKSRRKGAAELTKALSFLADLPNVECLVFGTGQLPPTTLPMPRLRELGSIRGTLQQRTVYSASDVFVLPSLEDNLPLTGLEAMACGTPVVAFAAGGIPDYVLDGSTGLLAATGDSDELGRHIRRLALSPKIASEMGYSARRLILREYQSVHEAKAYVQLYVSLSQTSLTKTRLAA
jgi:Glycosyl transferases group 1